MSGGTIGPPGAAPSAEATLAGEGERTGSEGGRDGAARLGSGATVGRYVVLSRLGAGGMGVVYVAYDPELDRKVALKILRRAGRRSSGADARDLREAQALARLTHPNVVTVYDVGTTDGMPFLAMELIDGDTLRQWADRSPRSWREVLGVLVPAGRGLAAAHAAGLVHGDLKPDNVMVASDGRALVMDFGLARAREPTDSSGAASSGSHALGLSVLASGAATRAGMRGTPGYMAPEQYRGEPGDDRIDQFGFCVTLWEALYGERPYAGDTPGAVLHAISTGRLHEPARDRSVPRWLRRAVERGLAREATSRWPSMDALLHELVRGQTRTKRRALAASVGAVVLAGVGTIVAAEVAEARAEAACATEAAAIDAVWPGEAGAARERARAAFSGTGLGYADDAFARTSEWLDEWSDAWRADRRAACDAGRRGRDPHVQAAAVACLEEHGAVLGALVEALGEADAAVVRRAVSAAAGLPRLHPCSDEQALARAPRPPAEAAGRIAEIREALARSRSLVAAGRYRDARAVAESALDEARALGWPPLVASAERHAGRAADLAGDPEGAERLLQAAHLSAVAIGDDEIAAQSAIALVSVVGIDRSRPDDGRLWGLQAGAFLRRAGDTEGMDAAWLELVLARIDRTQGAYDDAIARLERSIALREALLGPGHPDLAGPLNNLANVHLDRGAYDDAGRLYERAIAAFEASVGPDHPDTAQGLNNLGNVWLHRGNYDEAERFYRRALEIRERGLGEDHPDVAQSLTNVALVLMVRGDHEAAARAYQRALAIQERSHGPDHREVANVLINLAILRATMGDLDEAERLDARALEILERVHPGDHVDVARLLANLAELRVARGDLDEAERLVERSLAMAERSVGTDHPEVARARGLLGALAVERGDPEKGETLCETAQAMHERAAGVDAHGARSARMCRAAASLARGRVEEAVERGERELAGLTQRAASPADTANLRFLLARALWEAGRDRGRALELAREAVRDFGPGQPAAREAAERWIAEHAQP